MKRVVKIVVVLLFVLLASYGALAMEKDLTEKELAIVDLSAAVARGDQVAAETALVVGFDAGLTLNEAKETVGQLYAYCGFPRALNATATLMKVAAEKKPLEGATPSPPPEGKAVEFGAANQAKLCGGEVKGPLFDFHPQLDEYLKSHLFGDVFARDVLDWRTREIATIAALAARSETEPQMRAHIAIGKNNGVSDEQAEEIVERVRRPDDPESLPRDWSDFPVGEPNVAYAKYFSGRSFLAIVSDKQVPIAAVTFEPGCRNNWHVHNAAKGGGQVLVCTAGEGFYQERGKLAIKMKPGDTVDVPPGVEHWHGAAPNSWFQHLAIEVPGEDCETKWFEPVDDEEYAKATK